MKKHNDVFARENLEKVSTSHLDKTLEEELQKNPVDESAVKMILSVLEAREVEYQAEVTPEVRKAWTKYLARNTATDRTPAKRAHWGLRAASIAAVLLALLMVVPQEAEAAGFFERIARWTESLFEFITPGSEAVEQPEYVFETDNPGLQEVYNTLSELDVTDPVVPMWLPEGYELTSCEVCESPIKTSVLAVFSNAEEEILFEVDVYQEALPHKYEKDENAVRIYDLQGTIYNVVRNCDRWAVIWTKNNFECVITLECQEDTLLKIIKSIHETEDTK